MNQLGMVHPNLTTRLRNSYPSTVTIQSYTAAQDVYGCDTMTWTDIAGLVDLRCRFSPPSGGKKRTPAQIYDRVTDIIALASYKPTITTAMHAVVDSVNYSILNVRHDDNQRTTALDVERVV
jgi:hypothetical protein